LPVRSKEITNAKLFFCYDLLFDCAPVRAVQNVYRAERFTSMNNAAASGGVSELGDEICLKGVTPERFYRGSSSEPACGEPQSNHRLKHAGMTDFG